MMLDISTARTAGKASLLCLKFCYFCRVVLICPSTSDAWIHLTKPLPPNWTVICFGKKPIALEEGLGVCFVADEEELQNSLQAQNADICFVLQDATAPLRSNAADFAASSLLNIFRAHRLSFEPFVVFRFLALHFEPSPHIPYY